jgi:hypothetical protein
LIAALQGAFAGQSVPRSLSGLFLIPLLALFLPPLTISLALAASTTTSVSLSPNPSMHRNGDEENPSAPLNVMAACAGGLPIHYLLGPKSDIDKLYPAIKTESMSDYDYSMAIAASIQFYLRESLQRDQISACFLTVTPAVEGNDGYDVSFYSSDKKAANYETQTSWLNNGKLGLEGVLACQNDKSCWEPTGKAPSGAELTCLGPWQFYLPLGLPMASQKLVMFLHYPPYVAMQQSDYLNNATLNRWQRLLETVGVADWTLYTAIVDAFPIAAPGGSVETGCFPAASATKFFGDKASGGSGYIPTMLNALVRTTPNASNTGPTVPVIIYGQEAIGVWNSMYPNAQTDVLKAGSVSLDPAKTTPYMGANHPIAAVHYNCTTTPTIETMAKQDLSTACFAKAMAATPDADPVTAAAVCQDSYFSSKPDADHAYQICVTAKMDISPRFVTAACQELYFSTAPEAEFASQICAGANLAIKNQVVDEGIDLPHAKDFCEKHNNDPCAAGSSASPDP